MEARPQGQVTRRGQAARTTPNVPKPDAWREGDGEASIVQTKATPGV
jgi:hypothetical protein